MPVRELTKEEKAQAQRGAQEAAAAVVAQRVPVTIVFESVNAPSVGEVAVLSFATVDQESNAPPVFKHGELVDPGTITAAVVTPTGLSVDASVEQLSQGRYRASAVVESAGIHTWAVTADGAVMSFVFQGLA